MTSRMAQAAVAVSVLLVLAAAFLVSEKWLQVRTLKIGAGDKTSISYVFASALADVVAARSRSVRLQVVETTGSEDNIRLLQDARVDLAIIQNDARATPNARTVAFLYPQLFHLIASPSSGIQSVVDLAGKRVGTPPAAEGSPNSLRELMEHYQLTAEKFATLRSLPSAELAKTFLQGELDAIFRNDVIGEARTLEVIRSGRANIVTIDQGAAMRLTRPHLEVFTIPKGSYRANPPLPGTDVQTVGVQTTLLAHHGLDPSIVREITRLLFDHRLDLIARTPAAAWVSSPVNAASLSMAVHEGAKDYYDREKPSFIMVYSELIGLCLTIGAMLASAMLAVRAKMAERRKERADQFNLEICRLVEEIEGAGDLARLDEVKKQLFGIFRRVIEALDRDQISEHSMGSFNFAWRTALSSLQQRETVLTLGRGHAASGAPETVRAA